MGCNQDECSTKIEQFNKDITVQFLSITVENIPLLKFCDWSFVNDVTLDHMLLNLARIHAWDWVASRQKSNRIWSIVSGFAHVKRPIQFNLTLRLSKDFRGNCFVNVCQQWRFFKLAQKERTYKWYQKWNVVKAQKRVEK